MTPPLRCLPITLTALSCPSLALSSPGLASGRRTGSSRDSNKSSSFSETSLAPCGVLKKSDSQGRLTDERSSRWTGSGPRSDQNDGVPANIEWMGQPNMLDDVPVIRHWRLLRILAARRLGMTVRDLAWELTVDEKTIRRDLDRLQGLGFPLTHTEEARGRKVWRITHLEDCPPLQFTFDEAVALYLAHLFLEPMAGTELWQAAHRALQKIRATLSEDALAHLEKLLAVYHFTTAGLTNYARKAEIINTLSLAIEDCRVTRLTYESQQSAAPSPRDVHPYKLVRYKGSLYLFALAPEHKEVRRYKVDRIEACEMRSTSFPRPADFKVSSDLTGWFGMYSRAGMPDTQGFVGVVWGFAT